MMKATEIKQATTTRFGLCKQNLLASPENHDKRSGIDAFVSFRKMECTTDTCRILLNYVCPSIGSITAQLIFLSPMPVVIRIHRWLLSSERHLERPATINSVPYAWQFNNCLVWTLYAFLIQEYFISVGNILGVIFSLYYFGVLLSYSAVLVRSPVDVDEDMTDSFALDSSDDIVRDGDAEMQQQQNKKGLVVDASMKHQLARQNNISLTSIVGGVTVVLFGGFVAFLPLAGQFESQRMLLGVTCIIVMVVFLASPLSVMAQVVRDRDSRWIYWPLALAVVINGIMWGIYGLVRSDAFIYGPNFTGAILGLIQLGLILVFPAKRVSH